MKKYFIYPISLLSVLILSSCGPKIYIPDDTPDSLYARIAPKEHEALLEGLLLLCNRL